MAPRERVRQCHSAHGWRLVDSRRYPRQRGSYTAAGSLVISASSPVEPPTIAHDPLPTQQNVGFAIDWFHSRATVSAIHRAVPIGG
jgi:hypothetical protein